MIFCITLCCLTLSLRNTTTSTSGGISSQLGFHEQEQTLESAFCTFHIYKRSLFTHVYHLSFCGHNKDVKIYCKASQAVCLKFGMLHSCHGSMFKSVQLQLPRIYPPVLNNCYPCRCVFNVTRQSVYSSKTVKGTEQKNYCMLLSRRRAAY